MVCYGPRVATITLASAVVYALLHRLIGRILHIAGLVLEVTLIAGVAVAGVVLLTWMVRTVQRRRAAAGACTTCRFRCQQPVTFRPQPVTRSLPQPPTRRPLQPTTRRPLQPTTRRPPEPAAQADRHAEPRLLALR
jgi:hypothetical protein